MAIYLVKANGGKKLTERIWMVATWGHKYVDQASRLCLLSLRVEPVVSNHWSACVAL